MKLEILDLTYINIDSVAKKMFGLHSLHELFLRTSMKTSFPIKVFAKYFSQIIKNWIGFPYLKKQIRLLETLISSEILW